LFLLEAIDGMMFLARQGLLGGVQAPLVAPILQQQQIDRDVEVGRDSGDESDIMSIEDYPTEQIRLLKQCVRVMRVPDLCYLIYDYCDDGTMHRLSMTCKFQRKQLLSESPPARSVSKGYLVRILKFKY